jgi:hypothetical protein
MDEGNARFVRQFTQSLHSPSGVGLWHIWFRYSGNPIVTEMAAIAFQDGRLPLLETARGVTAAQVCAATEAELVVPDKLPTMPIQ